MTLAKLHSFLLLSIAALLPAYVWRFAVLGIPTNILEILIILAVGVGLLDQSVRGRWKQATQALPWLIKILVLIFILSAVISTLISPHLSTSLGILKGWVLFPILYGWLVVGYVSDERKQQKTTMFLNALLVSAAVVSLIGITQLGALDRIQSIYDVPNSLALFITPILAVTLWRAWTERSVVLGSAATVLFVALLGTQSVGAFMSLIAVLLIGFIRVRHELSAGVKRGAVVTLLAMAVLGGVLLQDKVVYLFSPQSSMAVRLQLWSVSWDLIREHPLAGVGLGTFEPAYQQQLHQQFKEYEDGIRSEKPLPEFVFRDPHNWILSFWLNVGFFGLLSFAALMWIAVRRSWRPYPALCLLLCATILLGVIDTIYWKNDLALAMWIYIFLVPGTTRRN